MNAKEARLKAESYKCNNDVDYFLKRLEAEATVGRFSYDYPGILKSDVKSELELLGYKIYDSSDRFETYTGIYWGDK